MLDLKAPEISCALQAVLQASWLARLIQSELAAPALSKQDRSPVTVADFAVQALASFFISKYFPDDALMGEEDSQALKTPQSSPQLAQATRYLKTIIPSASNQQVCDWIDRCASQPQGRYWVIDPIDGTKGFLRGGQYVIALALIEAGEVALGALGCPNLPLDNKRQTPGALFIAARGAGCWQAAMPEDQQTNPANLTWHLQRVSAQADPAQARLMCSFEASHTNLQALDRLAEHLHMKPSPLRLDSQVKYALLAAEQGDILIKPPPAEEPAYQENIWDHAAGMLVVEEAGGKVTDLDGKPLDLIAGRKLVNNRGILASNGYLHSAFLEAIRALEI